MLKTLASLTSWSLVRARSPFRTAEMVDWAIPEVPASSPLLGVADTLAGLAALGAAGRNRSQARVIAVTGSVGKTGTKEALRLALATSSAVVGGISYHSL